MEKLFYTVGEVSRELGEPQSTVRFWSDTFAFKVKPARNAKGNRLFHPEDVQALRQIQYLLTVEKLTLDGAAKRLRDDSSKTDKNIRIIQKLKEIKGELLEIKHYIEK